MLLRGGFRPLFAVQLGLVRISNGVPSQIFEKTFHNLYWDKSPPFISGVTGPSNEVTQL
jgi:hypothetical protein